MSDVHCKVVKVQPQAGADLGPGEGAPFPAWGRYAGGETKFCSAVAALLLRTTRQGAYTREFAQR